MHSLIVHACVCIVFAGWSSLHYRGWGEFKIYEEQVYFKYRSKSMMIINSIRVFLCSYTVSRVIGSLEDTSHMFLIIIVVVLSLHMC